MSVLSVPLQLLGSEALPPVRAHKSDAAFDVYATQGCILQPLQRALVPCGFSLAIPDGYAGLLLPRSGLALRNGISLVNSPGLIDAGYRGEIKAVLWNTDPLEPFEVNIGDRIAQLLIVKLPEVELVSADRLSCSDRGEQGFGSSGVS